MDIPSTETESPSVIEKAVDTESDDDCEGYFLEPSSCNVNISERIAEANRQLFEEPGEVEDAGEDATRLRKVQFCEKLVDFEPVQAEYYSDDAESVASEADPQIKTTLQTIKETKESQELNDSNQSTPDLLWHEEGIQIEELNETNTLDEADVITAETKTPDDPPKPKANIAEEENERKLEAKEQEAVNNSNVLVVLMPRDHYNSLESIIGEDVLEGSDICYEEEVEKVEIKEAEIKPRPKSANKSTKGKNSQKVNCKMATIAPELDCSVEAENRGWHETQNTRLRPKVSHKVSEESRRLKEVVLDNKEENRHVSFRTNRERPGTSGKIENGANIALLRPNTAPTKKPCCPIRTNLPRYNGLRSEYGLSSDQLEDRRRKMAEAKQQKREEGLNKRQEVTKKRLENEAKFSAWLETKSAASRSSSTSTSNKIDTLVRSDVFIQNNAVYATKCGVPYAVSNYPIRKSKIQEIRRKTVNLGKLFETLSPHAQKTYKIYLDRK